jgi:hypothetical protein
MDEEHRAAPAESAQARDASPAEQKGRFRRGQSGNPKGRPLGARGRKQIVGEFAREPYWVIENGDRARRSMLELVVLTIRNLALQGDRRAFVAWHKLSRKYDPEQRAVQLGYLLIPERGDEDRWKSMLAEQQAWLQARAARIEAGERLGYERFISRFEPPRSDSRRNG